MSEFGRILKLTGITALSIIVLIFVIMQIMMLVFFAPLMPWQGMRAAEKDLQKNKELIVFVKDYLAESKYDDAFIHDMDEPGTMFSSGFGRVPIGNAEAEAAIAELFERGYSSMGKEANCIHFTRWSNKDVGRGIAYSLDGSVPGEDAITFLTTIEPLTDDGWYYFDADYNEWRIRNRRN